MAGKVRLAAIQSILLARKRNCNLYTSKKAETTGTYPPNADNATKSIFVHELNEEEQQRYQKRMERLQRRINISGQLITTEEKIQNLAETIGKVKKFEHLCDLQYACEKNFFEIVTNTTSNPHNNCYLLTKMPSFPEYYVF